MNVFDIKDDNDEEKCDWGQYVYMEDMDSKNIAPSILINNKQNKDIDRTKKKKKYNKMKYKNNLIMCCINCVCLFFVIFLIKIIIF